jgi:hypothetical protein
VDNEPVPRGVAEPMRRFMTGINNVEEESKRELTTEISLNLMEEMC